MLSVCQCPLCPEFCSCYVGTGKRGHYERGFFSGGISKVSKFSKFSRVSRKWSASPLFSRVWRFCEISRISKSKLSRTSRNSTFLKRPLFQKTPFPKDPFFRTRLCGRPILSSAGAGGNRARPMRLPDNSLVLDKNRAPMGPEILSSTGAGVWRKAPMAFPDSSSVLGRLIYYHYWCWRVGGAVPVKTSTGNNFPRKYQRFARNYCQYWC